MMTLKATRSLRYATRQLLPGDIFEATPRDARLLIAIKKAAAVRAPAEVPPPPPALAEKIAERFAVDGLAGLRAEYETVVGKRPFYGWDAATLKEKIEAARALG